jgi:PhnB protein
MSVKPIPDGYHSVTPYLVIGGAAKLIDFLKEAFGAQEILRMPGPEGRIMHAEVKIGDSRIMMGEAQGQWQPMPSMLYLYVEDCDAIYKRAMAAGATSVSEPADMFYGDRHGAVKDPSGNIWYISTHTEDVSAEEMEKRSKAMMAKK